MDAGYQVALMEIARCLADRCCLPSLEWVTCPEVSRPFWY
jgi:hypothetical protein